MISSHVVGLNTLELLVGNISIVDSFTGFVFDFDFTPSLIPQITVQHELKTTSAKITKNIKLTNPSNK